MIKEKLEESVDFMKKEIKRAKLAKFAVMMTPLEAENVLNSLMIARYKIRELEKKLNDN